MGQPCVLGTAECLSVWAPAPCGCARSWAIADRACACVREPCAMWQGVLCIWGKGCVGYSTEAATRSSPSALESVDVRSDLTCTLGLYSLHFLSCKMGLMLHLLLCFVKIQDNIYSPDAWHILEAITIHLSKLCIEHLLCTKTMLR